MPRVLSRRVRENKVALANSKSGDTRWGSNRRPAFRDGNLQGNVTGTLVLLDGSKSYTQSRRRRLLHAKY